MPSEHTTQATTIAALVYDAGIDPAPAMEKFVRMLQERGVALAGAIQHNEGSCSMALEILPSGARMPISQNLGSCASGCRLDSVALAEASALVRMSLATAPNLALFNKFGAQEAAGKGMHEEMAAAATAGIPILTAVSQTLMKEWLDFTGGESAQLACSAEAALAWWDGLAKG